jgi:hypothetical protein
MRQWVADPVGCQCQTKPKIGTPRGPPRAILSLAGSRLLRQTAQFWGNYFLPTNFLNFGSILWTQKRQHIFAICVVYELVRNLGSYWHSSLLFSVLRVLSRHTLVSAEWTIILELKSLDSDTSQHVNPQGMQLFVCNNRWIHRQRRLSRKERNEPCLGTDGWWQVSSSCFNTAFFRLTFRKPDKTRHCDHRLTRTSIKKKTSVPHRLRVSSDFFL